MDRRTGEIMSQKEMENRIESIEGPKAQKLERTFYKLVTATPEQIRKGKVALKDMCPYGSGKCCRYHVKKKRREIWNNTK